MNTSSTEIANETRNRDEQSALAVLADGLPHVFETHEAMFKAVRRLAKAGRVTLTVLRRGAYSARLK